MELNGKNECIALDIIKMLYKNKCTVRQSDEILSFVKKYILDSSTVQVDEKAYVEKYC